MKIILTAVFLCTAFLVNAQDSSAEENGAKSKETKLTEVITTDSVPASELLKRAVNWIKIENPKYAKASGVSTSSKAECNVSFPVKPKELNPTCDYTGKILMKVIIECKDSKYKYTVEHIKHVSSGGKTSMGNIDNIIPECGSMIMPDLTLKKLKGEALKCAGLAVNDIKEGMKHASSEIAKEEW